MSLNYASKSVLGLIYSHREKSLNNAIKFQSMLNASEKETKGSLRYRPIVRKKLNKIRAFGKFLWELRV